MRGAEVTASFKNPPGGGGRRQPNGRPDVAGSGRRQAPAGADACPAQQRTPGRFDPFDRSPTRGAALSAARKRRPHRRAKQQRLPFLLLTDPSGIMRKVRRPSLPTSTCAASLSTFKLD
jgi:hypothetical protein